MTAPAERYNPEGRSATRPTNRVRTRGQPQPDRGGARRPAPAARDAERRLPLRARRRLGQGRGGAARSTTPRRLSAARSRLCSASSSEVRRQPRGSRASSSATASSTAPAPTTPRRLADREACKRAASRSSARAPGPSPSSMSRTPPRRPWPRSSSGAPGIYNVVDDEPAPMREWLPVYAEAVGRQAAAPGARSGSPAWSPASWRRLMATESARRLQREGQARAGLAAPRYASWRQGFREARGIEKRPPL